MFKTLLITTIVLLCESSVFPQGKKNVDKPISTVRDNHAAKALCINFTKWYLQVADSITKNIIVENKQNDEFEINFVAVNKYLDQIKNSGYASPVFINDLHAGFVHESNFLKLSHWKHVSIIDEQDDGSITFNVGHTFVSFTKNNTDGTSITQTMGFYPGGNGVRSDGIVKDDGGHGYSISYSKSVTAGNFNLALQLVVDNSNLAKYQLSNTNLFGGSEFNCTDAAIAWMTEGGAAPPNPTQTTHFDTNPGQYGEDLRSIPETYKTPGYAPQSHGPCN